MQLTALTLAHLPSNDSGTAWQLKSRYVRPWIMLARLNASSSHFGSWPPLSAKALSCPASISHSSQGIDRVSQCMMMLCSKGLKRLVTMVVCAHCPVHGLHAAPKPAAALSQHDLSKSALTAGALFWALQRLQNLLLAMACARRMVQGQALQHRHYQARADPACMWSRQRHGRLKHFCWMWLVSWAHYGLSSSN